ncbi:MAG: hypothetical protein ABIG42_05975, partial [bacterium]
MKTLSSFLLSIIFIFILIGCSAEKGISPVIPSENTIENLWQSDPYSLPSPPVITDIPRADFSPLAGGDVKENPEGLLFAGTLELDAESGTITNTMDREPMFNWNVTGYLLSG